MSRQKPPRNHLKNVAMLSGIAFEMGAIIYLAAKGGLWLDARYQNDKNYFTAGATILGVALSIWVVLRQLKHLHR